MMTALRQLLPAESTWPPARDAVDAETAARLRSLGYLSADGGGASAWGVDDDPKNLMHLDAAIHRFSDLFAAGRYAEAANEARKVVAARPSMRVGHFQLSQALLELGDVPAALDAMEAARRLDAASPALLRQLGLTLARVGRAGEALEILQPLVAAEDGASGGAGGDPETLSAYGLALDQAGRPGDARGVLQRALELAPDDALVHERLSVVALRLGDAEAARRHARSAVDLDPSLAHAWNNLGVALYMLGRPADALDPWVRSLALDPDQFDTLYNVGVKAAELGRPDLARRALSDFLERAPRDRYQADLPHARALLERLERAASGAAPGS
jgi:superkiller protein 3